MTVRLHGGYMIEYLQVSHNNGIILICIFLESLWELKCSSIPILNKASLGINSKSP